MGNARSRAGSWGMPGAVPDCGDARAVPDCGDAHSCAGSWEIAE